MSGQNTKDTLDDYRKEAMRILRNQQALIASIDAVQAAPTAARLRLAINSAIVQSGVEGSGRNELVVIMDFLKALDL